MKPVRANWLSSRRPSALIGKRRIVEGGDAFTFGGSNEIYIFVCDERQSGRCFVFECGCDDQLAGSAADSGDVESVDLLSQRPDIDRGRRLWHSLGIGSGRRQSSR